jgi:hypothetical protein
MRYLTSQSYFHFLLTSSTDATMSLMSIMLLANARNRLKRAQRDNGRGLEQACEPHENLRFLDADKSLPFLEFYKQMRNNVSRRH